MGSHTRPDQSNTSHTMNTKLVLLFAFVCAASGRVFLIDDGEVEQFRVRRDAPPSYGPPAPPLPHTDPLAEWVPSTPSSRPTLRPTSSGESDTGPGLSMEDRKDERDITDLVQIERYINIFYLGNNNKI